MQKLATVVSAPSWVQRRGDARTSPPPDAFISAGSAVRDRTDSDSAIAPPPRHDEELPPTNGSTFLHYINGLVRRRPVNASGTHAAHSKLSTWNESGVAAAAGRSGRCRHRRLQCVLLLIFLLCLLSMLLLIPAVHGILCFSPNSAPSSPTPPPQHAVKSSPSPPLWSVLVHHKDAVDRFSQFPRGRCFLFFFCEPVRWTLQLPSWTLHVVDPACVECTDRGSYAEALPATSPALELANGAVFASPAAPLGRIGPMLLAMASVTNAVNIAAETPKWAWMQFANSGAPRLARPVRAPYLAVMGVPSTDNANRASLREAQRQTWMSYSEVARASNGFRGALLVLHLLAHVEPVGQSKSATASTVALLAPVNASHLLPSRAEWVTLSSVRLATEKAMAAATEQGGATVPRVRYTMPRMALRADWPSVHGYDSPCSHAYRATVGGAPGEETDPLPYLTEALSLPVVPAFVSPAQFVCYASASLWQEALEHRNVIWIDMMTDRRPTTDKKLGQNKNWGLPVEVGMSQKLILWLEYAYHAFPDVSYIMKGDDDAYLKVPQYLNDVRFLHSEKGKPILSREEVRLMPRDTIPLANESMCTYWGSTRSYHEVLFNAGMCFMLHRKLAQAVLEPSMAAASKPATPEDAGDGRGNNLQVRLALKEFDPSLSNVYRRTRYQVEDIMAGTMIKHHRARAEELCWNNTVYYVRESLARFHDLRVGRARSVRWTSVVVHRCSATDFHFIHYYFTHAHRMPVLVNATNAEEEAAAQRSAWAWVAQQKLKMPQYNTWDDTPSVQWVPREGAQKTAAHVIVPGDAVAVYMHGYAPYSNAKYEVRNGYISTP
ncbi:unspecified product [Leptomonas pyrrhocoris]|uniref:Unspecified product n=1 Tax=Leptomonas pyrrhocoris TaxID=157538 RepID=A0A0M9FS39_LEPPY|nr:unspecified product [Leptomonas pyrrhocoris]XP_015653296.1 unspecified product [Leptomonas pyrrhocoris]KPA74856.1 unspecified product [Leptomonas pyrrhocoris]KPA74857.1 unspecified product [Leptomonas pyrrhocoris]|eukprot:XP_015653295.1 unspecified product [Leptomonas pyrrhocoris]